MKKSIKLYFTVSWKRVFIVFFFIAIFAFINCNQENGKLYIDKTKADLPFSQTIEYLNNKISENTNESLVHVSPSEKIKILVRSDGAPGMYLGDDGQVHGFYVDLERMIMEEMGQNYEFIPYSDVAEGAFGLKVGTHHIALATPYLSTYTSILNLSQPFEVLQFITFVRSSDNRINGTTSTEIIEQLKDKKVGVQVTGILAHFLSSKKIKEIIQFPTTTQAMKALDEGLVDAVPDVQRIGEYYLKKNGWDIKPVGVPIYKIEIGSGISRKYDLNLIERYNKALSKIIEDGRRDSLYEQYFGVMPDNAKP